MALETDLSEREIEILRLVATGVSNKEIAYQLAISPNTVKVHLRNVFTKIGASSRTEAALIAVRMGLVEQGAAELQEEPVADIEEKPLIPQAEMIPARRGWQRWLGLGALVVVALAALVVAGLAFSRGSLFSPAPTPTLTPAPTPTLAPTAPPAVSAQPSRWSEVSAMPAGRNGMAAAVYEGAIYIFGGETAQGVSGSSLRYRPSQGGWESLAEKPTAVTDVQAAVLGERIYIPGGRAADGKPVNVLEAYLPRLNQWDELAPIPAALSGYGLAAYEGRLYLFGGWNGSTYSTAVYSYDPDSNTWQTHTPLPSPRAYLSAAVVETKIYVIGGFDGQHALRDVLVYFPDRDHGGDQPWEERAPLPDGRYGMGCTALANMIYLVGGLSDPSQTAELTPLVYQPLNDRWTTFDNPPEAVGNLPALLGLETRLHVLGGKTAAGLQANDLTYQAIYTIAIPSIQQ